MQRQFYSVREAAEQTALSPSMIRKLIRSGRLEAVTLPGVGVVRIPAEAFDKFISEWRPVQGPVRPGGRRAQ